MLHVACPSNVALAVHFFHVHMLHGFFHGADDGLSSRIGGRNISRLEVGLCGLLISRSLPIDTTKF